LFAPLITRPLFAVTELPLPPVVSIISPELVTAK